MKPTVTRAVLGGFVGTLVMTLMMYFVAPMLIGTKMDIAQMLGSMLGGSWILGMMMHFVKAASSSP